MLTLYKSKEINRNCLPLVNHLEEGVLTVGTGFTKVYLANGIINLNTIFVYSLSI